jgi:hypothetical protein
VDADPFSLSINHECVKLDPQEREHQAPGFEAGPTDADG